MSTSDRISWLKQTNSQWKTRSKRGHVGTIDYAGIGLDPYTLTVTGAGAPAPASYPNLRDAKNAFRKFIHTAPANR